MKQEELHESDKEARIEFSLRMALSLLVHANINKVSTNVKINSGASPMSGPILYCPFERFQEAQRSLV